MTTIGDVDPLTVNARHQKILPRVFLKYHRPFFSHLIAFLFLIYRAVPLQVFLLK